MFTQMFGPGRERPRPRRRASLENPSVSLSDPDAWEEAFGGGLTDAGVPVNDQTLMGQPAFWRGVNLLAAGVAKLPLDVYERLGENGKRRAVDHPAYRLLRRKPNRNMTAGVFRRTLQYHALLRGNGYAAIFRDGAGLPVELLILDPCETWPVQARGALWYRTKAGTLERTLAAEDVLHVRGLSFDGLVGHAVLDVLADALGLGMAARKFGSKFFAGGSKAGGVLMVPRGMPEAAAKRLQKDFEEQQGRADQAFRTAILEEGTKWQATTIAPEQAQFLQTREFEIREVANVLGLPPHKLGDSSRTAYNSLEQENRAYLDESLDPWLCTWEEECSDKLLSEREKEADSHFVEFNRAALERTDYKSETDSLVAEVNNGLLSPDEARSIRNRPPIPGGAGEKFRSPVNIGLLGQATPPGPPAAGADTPDAGGSDGPALDAALRALVFDRVARLAKIEQDEVGRAAARGGNFVEWLNEFAARHRGRVEDALAPACGVLAAIAGRPGAGDEAHAFAAAWCAESLAAFLAAAEAPAAELAESVGRTLAGLSDGRVERLTSDVFKAFERKDGDDEEADHV